MIFHMCRHVFKVYDHITLFAEVCGMLILGLERKVARVFENHCSANPLGCSGARLRHMTKYGGE